MEREKPMPVHESTAPRSTLLAALGYDLSIVDRMAPSARDAMQRHAALWLVACVLLAVSAATAAWVALPSYWAPVVMGAFVFSMTLNLLRVAISGGGATPAKSLEGALSRCRRWQPSTVPMLVFLALAVMLSQPAQLLWWKTTLDPQVETYRDTLLNRHERAASALGVDAAQVRKEIQSAGFPLQRLKFLWGKPERAGIWTLLFCFLILVPGFWSRWVAIDALRQYERGRTRQKHRSQNELQRTTQRELALILQPFRPVERS